MQTGIRENTVRLKAKDFITLGIFSVLFIIICFIGIFATSIVTVTQPFGIALAALLGAPVYLYMRLKVPAFGGILLGGLLLALAMLVTGSGWIIPGCILLGALLAELLARAGHYKNTLLLSLGYALLMTLYAAGSYMPMLLMKESYYELALSNSVDNSFMLELLDFYTGPLLAGALLATAALALIGCLVARSMMKKHFIKAGMVS